MMTTFNISTLHVYVLYDDSRLGHEKWELQKFEVGWRCNEWLQKGPFKPYNWSKTVPEIKKIEERERY